MINSTLIFIMSYCRRYVIVDRSPLCQACLCSRDSHLVILLFLIMINNDYDINIGLGSKLNGAVFFK